MPTPATVPAQSLATTIYQQQSEWQSHHHHPYKQPPVADPAVLHNIQPEGRAVASSFVTLICRLQCGIALPKIVTGFRLKFKWTIIIWVKTKVTRKIPKNSFFSCYRCTYCRAGSLVYFLELTYSLNYIFVFKAAWLVGTHFMYSQPFCILKRIR